MILTVDIGNTHIHLGLFIRGALRKTWSLTSNPHRTADEYSLLLRGLLGDGLPMIGSVMCSVVPRLDRSLARAVEQEFKTAPLILDQSMPLGVCNGYEHPEEVGMDRLANASGAYYLYGAPVMVLDFGTAITLDYVAIPRQADGTPVYQGGAIMPGVEMAADALVRGTARLPTIPFAEPRRAIGRTTAESIQSGLMHGYIGAISCLVDRAREEIGTACPVVATGGDAMNLARHLPFIHAVEPNLTHYGLRHIYGINRDYPLPPRI